MIKSNTVIDFVIIGAKCSGIESLKGELKLCSDIKLLTEKFEIEQKDIDVTDLNVGVDLESTNTSNRESYHLDKGPRAGQKGQIQGYVDSGFCMLPEQSLRVLSRHFPDVKIVFCMMEPIHRCWAQICCDALQYREKGYDVDFIELAQKSDVLAQSDYPSIIKRWADIFGDDRIHCVFYDDMATDLEGVLRDLFRFLGIPDVTRTAHNQTKKNNCVPDVEMPNEVFYFLWTILLPVYRELSHMFGQPCQGWLDNLSKISKIR